VGLPGLATALDPARMSVRLGELLGADSGTAPAAWRVVGVELLKHKPGRRCALAYSLDGPHGRQRIFAKTFKNERGAAIFVSMRSFFEALAGAPIRVPRPIGYLTEIKLLVTEYVEGRDLAAVLYEGRSDEAARRMARAAAAFHGASVVCARRWSPGDWGRSWRACCATTTRSGCVSGVSRTAGRRRGPAGQRQPAGCSSTWRLGRCPRASGRAWWSAPSLGCRAV